MKRMFAMFAMLAVLAAIAALPFAAASQAAPQKNIVQTAAAAPQFSTLVKLVKAAGLAGALSGRTKLTVFAPTNAAFAKVPKATLAALGKNKALLKKVLLYHVVRGELKASQVVKRHALETLEGADVTIKVRHAKVYVNKAQIVKANVFASNGVIHVVNAVLIPPK
jgi:uncharacterized surface protein with fasciclin (FAS1) repeats